MWNNSEEFKVTVNITHKDIQQPTNRLVIETSYDKSPCESFVVRFQNVFSWPRKAKFAIAVESIWLTKIIGLTKCTVIYDRRFTVTDLENKGVKSERSEAPALFPWLQSKGSTESTVAWLSLHSFGSTTLAGNGIQHGRRNSVCFPGR